MGYCRYCFGAFGLVGKHAGPAPQGWVMPQRSIDPRKPGRRPLTCAPLARIACGAALAGLAICAGSAMAYAGDDDTISSSTSFYDKFLQTIGVEGGAAIDYSERSPLVVPPTRDLPPPTADRPPPASDWPKDPDIARRAQAKVKEKPRYTPDYAVVNSLPLRPDQLNAPGANTGAASAPGAAGSNGPSGADYPEKEIKNQSNPLNFFENAFKKEQYATFTGEPERTSLTDPPPGYLTPSPDQPYGIGPGEKKYKVPTVADRATPVSGTSGGN